MQFKNIISDTEYRQLYPIAMSNKKKGNDLPAPKKKASHFCEALSFLVAGTGLEPVTFGL